MTLLRDRVWLTKYHSDAGALVNQFYEPALACAVRYDRSTGYFTAGALTLAARGVEALIRNSGRMRLIVGCTLDQPAVEAIEHGMAVREAIALRLSTAPVVAVDPPQEEALELVAWMVAKAILEVKVAIPCGTDRKPVVREAIFHEKAGVIEDAAGDRLAFNGSVNETIKAWAEAGLGNWESFHAFTSFGGTEGHVKAEEETFARLWSDQAQHARVVDVPTAVRENLLQFLPKNDALPHRLLAVPEVPPEAPVGRPAPASAMAVGEPKVEAPAVDLDEVRRQVWALIREAPSRPGGGESVGEATSAVVPWPHQVRAFQRMYDAWPPRLLIADEVGLGKTIEAGLVLRQAWLSGRARRILVLTPRAVLSQWQIELRDKFNLNWPIYDGRVLHRYPCRALGGAEEREVSRTSWHQEPFVLASSHLMRRGDRARELLEAEPWDLVVLDEAHHARRRGAGSPGRDKGPNQLLKLLLALKDRTKGLILMTATPMQVHPVEVWDLLSLLGLPSEWSCAAFLKFFELIGQPSPSSEFLVEEHPGTYELWSPGSPLFPAASDLGAPRSEPPPRLLDLLPDERRGPFRP